MSHTTNTGCRHCSEPTLKQQLDKKPSVHNFVEASGLEPIANAIDTQELTVCDLNTHGVQGCADYRAQAEQIHQAAEITAIGLSMFVILLIVSAAGALAALASKTSQAHAASPYTITNAKIK